jgi:hypothetical protein
MMPVTLDPMAQLANGLSKVDLGQKISINRLIYIFFPTAK